MTKRLYKSNTNKVISGVCGGLGEYFNIDPSIIRIIWVIIVFLTAIGGGIIAYIACAVLIPNAPHIHHDDVVDHDQSNM